MPPNESRHWYQVILAPLKRIYIFVGKIVKWGGRMNRHSPPQLPLQQPPPQQPRAEPNIEIAVDDTIQAETNPLRTGAEEPFEPPPQTEQHPEMESFSDEVRMQVLLKLYPIGNSTQELVSRISENVGNPSDAIRDLIEKGLATSTGEMCNLTDMGMYNVQTYLMNELRHYGIGRFYELVRPYLEVKDEWSLRQYNTIIREIIFHNLDVLHFLITEQSFENIVMSTTEIRKIGRDDEPHFTKNLERLILALEALNLVVVRSEGNVDYLKITAPCKHILYLISGEMEKMYRGKLLLPATTPQLLTEKTKKMAKKFFIALPILLIGTLIVTSVMQFDITLTCGSLVGVTFFLTLVYLYALNRF